MHTSPRRALPVALLAALVTAGAAASAGGPTLVPQVGVRHVRLGDSQAGVRAVLGAPRSARWRDDQVEGRILTLRYPALRVEMAGVDRVGVIRLVTTSRDDVTRRGAGVGSTRAQVRAAVGGVRCEGAGADLVCRVGPSGPDLRGTVFAFAGGRVRQVTVGFFGD